jgi:hypothetical protein
MLCWTFTTVFPCKTRLVQSEPSDLCPMILAPALAYVLPVFAAAFVVGAIRVMLIAPVIGAFAAVALEVPLVLAFSWIVAGRVLRRWPLPRAAALGMGTLAFLILMLAELALARLLSGQPPAAYAATFLTPPGALGLAGQIGFALIPALRAQPRG